MLKTVSKLVSASQIKTPITLVGDVTLSTGNLVIGTAGKGIDFSADPSAAGMTSELLDDYEEGTFTVSAIRVTDLTTGAARYTKVGRLVTCEINLSWTATDNTGSTLIFTGLPFASATGNLKAVAVAQVYGTDVNTDVGQTIVVSIDDNDTRFLLTKSIQASLAYVNANQMNSATTLIATFSYTTT